ncbi:protein of unknown function [Pseudodesulfovibrio piezophilus C1TLV30]|uniref:Uncharacterized protein n=1 Tax=Pseudodesulfovibrio piezophilus (strain DSM 21447 / JCM 15486 / C1TLV30) TaxID=1322246 RepID=M1WS93_PSEP2|nr:protein of unknown function [Pseudodesulfovibrio piezophilus C1TLV30]
MHPPEGVLTTKMLIHLLFNGRIQSFWGNAVNNFIVRPHFLWVSNKVFK